MNASHIPWTSAQQPLAAVVVGGLVTSTVLTLLVVPALYKWFATDGAGKISALSDHS